MKRKEIRVVLTRKGKKLVKKSEVLERWLNKIRKLYFRRIITFKHLRLFTERRNPFFEG